MCQFDGRFWGKYYRLWRSTSILPRVTPDGETVIGYDGELEQWDEIVVELIPFLRVYIALAAFMKCENLVSLAIAVSE